MFGVAKLNPPREHMYQSSVTKGCVCVRCETLGEESNGSTINGQVHLDNADGVISRPSEALFYLVK